MNANRPSRFRRAALYVAGLSLAAATAYAYKVLAERPGQDTFAFVPADAIAFGALDLTPAPSQILAFKRIDDALGRNKLDGFIERMIGDVVSGGGGGEQLAEMAKRSAAFAALETTNADGTTEVQPIFFLPVKDGDAVESMITNAGEPRFWRGTKYIKFRNQNTLAMVHGDTLVVGFRPEALWKVRETASGRSPSVIADKGYLAARAKLDNDSNFMAFARPKWAKSVGEVSNKRISSIAESVGWCAVGASIREDGIAVSAAGDTSADQATALKLLAEAKPIPAESLQSLPAGMYGAVTVSQPGNIGEFVVDLIKGERTGQEDVAGFDQDMKKKFDFGFESELLPALKGTAVVAAYPADLEKGTGMDVLAVFDESNGADPGAIAQKVKGAFEHEYAEGKEKSEPLFTAQDHNGVTIYSLNSKEQKNAQKDLSDSLSFLGESNFEKTTVSFGVFGKTVLASSNVDLLKSAISQRQSNQASAIAGRMQETIRDGAQFMLTLDVGRIARSFEAMMKYDDMDPRDVEETKDIFDLFTGLQSPLIFAERLTASEGRINLFIPLDFEKILDMVGKHANEEQSIERKPQR